MSEEDSSTIRFPPRDYSLPATAHAIEEVQKNPRFITGTYSLKWKTISSPIHFPPMMDAIALERHESLHSRTRPRYYWMK